ncbi:alginate export family protein [Mucilaginibacter lappiensis]|uniref:alginate export family protein n=1 Tax=Mucilaginibacter lappiensis TaxID=354630 RepID=UPI003D1A0526
MDLFYLGIDRANARFDEGVADESRHTFGVRFWRNGSGLLYNFEAGYQSGKFGRNNIRAWGASSEVCNILKREILSMTSYRSTRTVFS